MTVATSLLDQTEYKYQRTGGMGGFVVFSIALSLLLRTATGLWLQPSLLWGVTRANSSSLHAADFAGGTVEGERSLLALRAPRVVRAPMIRPCSALASAPVIFVRSEKDIAKRTQYPNTRTVVLMFVRSLRLTRGLILGEEYSCTILRTPSASQPIQLVYRGWDAPVVSVIGSGNILFIGISITNGVNSGAPQCKFSGYKYGFDTRVKCPALYIIESFGIQYTRASVYGRVDIFRSVYSRLDSIRATMAPASYSLGPYRSFNTHGVIRVGECGDGVPMIGSGIAITNSEVYGSWELITLYRGTIGVTVANNYLHSYIFAAVRCGADVTYVMDCHLNAFRHNFVYSPPGVVLTGDSAAFYTCTHWFNPGNVFDCNYAYGGDHCYYFDYASSGVEIDGGVCVRTGDGVKLNTGKLNRVRSLLMVQVPGAVSYVSCITSVSVHCNRYPGSVWEAYRRTYYNSLSINGRFPYMRTLCNPPKAKIDGKECNPKGSLPPRLTQGCAGMPYKNDVELVVVQGGPKSVVTSFCNQLPGWAGINRQVAVNLTMAEARFRGPGDFSYGPGSLIPRLRPGFKACPRQDVGPRLASISSYYSYWNMQKPGILSRVISFDFIQVFPNM